jgi:hypothetical protein
MEIAVAELPVCEAIPPDGVHLHVGREQVVAAVSAFSDDVVYEHLGIEAFA